MALNGSSQQAASTKRNERSLSPITSRLKRMRHEASKAKYIELPSGEEKSLNRTRISSREHDHSTGNTSTAREHIRYVLHVAKYTVLTISFLTANVRKRLMSLQSSLR